MVETKIRKGTFQHVESELRAFHDTKKLIVRLKNEIMQNQHGQTNTLLQKHLQREQMERVVEAIEYVTINLPPERVKLIKLYYWTKPQLLTWEGIAQQLNCNRATAIRWRDETVASVAARLGWR